MSSRLLNRRQARWGMFLSEFDFKLDWAPGKSNVADAASRRADFVLQEGDEHLSAQHQTLLSPTHLERLNSQSESDFPPNFKSDEQIHSLSALTTLSIDNSELLERFKAAFKEDVTWREALASGNSDFTTSHDIVFHKGRLYVPPPLRRDVLFSRHDSVIGGHPGRHRTERFVSRDYSWPGMSTYIRKYVEACDTCPRSKSERQK
ncbi:hypothetical protein MPER_00305, partial [Moniliophthora perniciosa FA553]